MSSPTPTRTIAGVKLVDSAIVRNALDYSRRHSDEITFNHTYRSWIFGVLLATRMGIKFDPEVHAVAAMLHDLAWEYTSQFASPDKRFEVDSAEAARQFLADNAPEWESRKTQLVWDSIALHTTPGIAQYKEAEVMVCNMGVLADIVGANFPGGLLSQSEYQTVVKELPRLRLEAGIKRILCNLCIHKPDTTYDNVVARCRPIELPQTKGALSYTSVARVHPQSSCSSLA
ncbi:hypothetical protein BDY17DRAFT_314187 [Neohortaea acidophila]|uniref:HD domain-containing protein n=1 Tax=Neohortaea acidophila TaxID=245834 RepID=A0A6A6PEV7_9PEZI|nr:uncharacterized protein BDY17DRAFT_314187 [Neohortaea acidophila]KAF2478509.1 hypothetical protein BDY17DRAFT_314187 [Neohortaea acidophila]